MSHPARLWLCAALLAAGTALPAAGAELPPPGLYRIDVDGTMQFAGNPTQLRLQTEGATGDTSATWKNGNRSATRQYKGDQPVTHCVKAVTAEPPLPPQALRCKAQSTVKTADGWVHTATCPESTLRLTIRQLDQDHWEYLHAVTMLSSGAAPSMAGVEMLLQQQARHGATAAERAKAQAQLARLPAMQQQANAGYDGTVARMKEELTKTTDPDEKAALQSALARLAPGNPTMQTSARMLWTRIGNSCGNVK